MRALWQREGLTVGFVPTMGALHEGHLSLVRQAKQHCDKVVSSIFVNPAQFAPHEDLQKYPRTLEKDLELLSSLSQADNDPGIDCVLVPQVQDMYPSGITLDVSKQVGTFVQCKGKSHQMEGAIRPNFFTGVCTVVSKLFNIVQPTHAFFGQKDAQQCSVIITMTQDLLFPIKIVIGETVRHEDGLAMSSRNRYLTPDQRAVSIALFRGLEKGRQMYASALENGTRLPTPEQIKQEAEALIRSYQGVEFEYLSLADPVTLVEYEKEITSGRGAIFSGAIRVGTTRLIDNVLLGFTVKDWTN